MLSRELQVRPSARSNQTCSASVPDLTKRHNLTMQEAVQAHTCPDRLHYVKSKWLCQCHKTSEQ